MDCLRTPVAPNRRTVLIGLAGACVASTGRAGPSAWPRTAALLGGYVDAGKLAGGCVTIRRGAQVSVLTRGAGALGGPPVNERTLWRIFSMTKPVTGVAALALIEERKLGLDQPVADFIPAFANPQVLEADGALRPARTRMTVRHLLTHTAGLGYAIVPDAVGKRYEAASLTPGDPTPRPAAPRSLEEFGERLAREPLIADPGTRYQYSVSLDLLGLVIQNASGTPFGRYLRHRLFDPMAMTDTGFQVSESQKARLAQNYEVRDGGIAPLEPEGQSPYLAAPPYPSGGGGLVSSARDYDRFCAMLLADGAFDGRQVIARATARRARSNLLPRSVPGEDGAVMGAGMGVVTEASAQAGGPPPGSAYWGGAAGTSMWIDPVNDLSVVLMTQFMPSRAYPLWDELPRAVYADLAA
ncbi:MAG: serine hydrolase domain-containing protein [Hyphomonadaceae bacterium]|nr:serine hydrolase domain-containing protein [Hyphomonadaceae bacterium]